MRTGARVALRYWARIAGVCLLGLVALLALAALAARAMPPPSASVIEIPFRGSEFGGWSGIDVSPDGARFWIVTDRGKRTQGKILRNDGGRIVGIDAPEPRFLPGLRGDEIAEYPDAEGIDVRPSDGQAYVSFEGFARLRSYGHDWHRARWVPDNTLVGRLHENRGFEAVARDRFGRVYTLPERVRRLGAPYPLYRYTRRHWMSSADWTIATQLTSDEGWRAAGADFGPDGAFYLLERRFNVFAFASRIRRFDVLNARQDDLLEGRVVFESPLGRHGNLEGIGLWRDGDGRLRAVLVGDDNRRWIQRAEILEVILDVPTVAPNPLASGALGK